ncbi:DNA polymerase III subunit delta [Blochmannia endosymbiont of Camponotus sp.]|uniref:DNA polymerase III subunit delta n=1 Tax=Blochmannia endosymbiont of Camponotus sp. TaxID=700220 RepID=UPI0020240C49|nr:DNA polymerase III subunit delta [Blochmannia endosymbiont of Camponotus sp.]URJ23649.1 DNA polymerase III subunit delta [Blochmannia endosymbiont of Camponotus sp.]
MIWIYPEQLFTDLKKELRSVYVLLGNDSYFLENSCLNIVNAARMLNFNEYVQISLDVHSNWENIFNLFRVSSLFEKRKILSLKFPQDYSVAILKKNAPLLFSLLHDDLVLILYIHESNQINKNNIWLQCFNKTGMFVDCSTPAHTRLIMWIENQAKNMKLVIENLACQLLCYYYEGNLTLLNQTLQNLSFIYPDGNLNFIRVKKIVTDSAYFNMNHWIESILTGNKQRADRILKKLEYIGVDLELLLCKIRSEILMITNMKYNMVQGESLFNLLKQYKIYKKYHCMLLSRAVNRLSLHQLHQAIELLAQIELIYKKDYIVLSRSSFELLSLILCHDKRIALK